MTVPVALKLIPLSAALITLAACDSSSSSSSSDALSAQAVDGYIVSADVDCDGVDGGKTRATGQFNCPAGTEISKIAGGFDVGDDEEATTGTIAFTGLLSAPASEPYVTPLTTLAVAIAQASGEAFSLESYENAQVTVAQTLGISLNSFTVNPVVDIEVAKSNAMVHQILISFAPDIDSYEEAASAFASVIVETGQTGGVISLVDGVDTTLALVNEELATSRSELELSTAGLNQASENVLTANAAINSSESVERVVDASQNAVLKQAPLTIVRNDANVVLTTTTGSETLTLSDFENSDRTEGLYEAQLFSDLTDISYDTDAFEFNQDINNSRITVAFELKSVNAGDRRSISFTSDDVVVSAFEGDSDSLSITTATNNSTFTVYGTDSSGVTTRAEADTDGDTLDVDGGDFTINLAEINEQLTDLGFEDILATSGDYSATLIISGLSVNEDNNGEVVSSEVFTVSSGSDSVSGNGFLGYVSIIR